MSVNLITYRQYDYYDIKLTVKVDRINKTVSFVEKDKYDNWSPKQWIFADRGVEYMNGWLTILAAMWKIIEELKIELEGFADDDTEKFMNMMIELSNMKAPDKPKELQK